jgi:hypothetical protein
VIRAQASRGLLGVKMKTAILAVAIFGALSLVAGAQEPNRSQLEQQVAQELQGTIYTLPHRESADGVITACGIEFSVLTFDHSTKGGAPVLMVGSYYLRKINSGLIYLLKLGVKDGMGTQTTASAPANAFVSAPAAQASLKKPIRSESDMPGFALFGGELDKAALVAYESILKDQKLLVGFNRKAGQQDVVAVVDVFSVCSKNLVSSMR